MNEDAIAVGLIPESPTQVIDETTSRFSSAIWYEEVQKQKVLLAGCGGIGSYVAFLLGRMKVNSLTLIDPDLVEAGNLSGQFFGMGDLGSSKVGAMRNMVRSFSGFDRVYTLRESVTSTTSYSEDVMICGFDNMTARQDLFNIWVHRVNNTPTDRQSDCLFIDGRLAAEEFQVFAVTGSDKAAIDQYRNEFLFSDDEAEATVCSYKQTSYMANMIGSVMVNIFTNFCANKCGLIFPREVPFLTTYRADFMDFKVQR